MCQAQEAAKKQRTAIQQGPSHPYESILQSSRHPYRRSCLHYNHSVLAGCTQFPTYCVSCYNCKKLGHFSRVYSSKTIQRNELKPTRPSTFTLQSIPSLTAPLTNRQPCPTSTMYCTSTDLALKLKIDIATLNGATTTAVLPESGANISAASTSILSQLNKHIDNLLPFSVIPKAANGS